MNENHEQGHPDMERFLAFESRKLVSGAPKGLAGRAYHSFLKIYLSIGEVGAKGERESQ